MHSGYARVVARFRVEISTAECCSVEAQAGGNVTA